MSGISTIGLQLISLNNLQSQQTNLLTLEEQLGSGVQHNDLTQYDPTTAHKMLDLQNSVTQRQSYISSMDNVSATLSSYDLTMTDMESVNSGAASLAQQTQAYTPANQAQLQSQVQDYLKQLTDDLNQQVGSRYIFSGSRYNTQPVTDLSALTTTPTTTTTTSPALANYDSAYVNSSSSDANAYATSTATVDANYSISYGVSSNAPAIQQLVNGLRFLQQASTATDAASYASAISNANSLLASASTGIQALHAGVAGNQNIVKSETTIQTSNIASLQDQLGNLQNVDTATIGTELTAFQTQLQASYSATASLEQLSLVKYL